ncbi:MAG: aminotransferase class V-fold PLP-dependent enzyme [Clostridia bacterium]|nr:aminotransferase class V-fold PLP-dependent enzyme [Clostridia bacterium]MDH7573771.1 aminotransferase class V-fold PLP-dependent enzyme [Clostridia bacterium]
MGIYLDNAATSFPKPEAVYRAVLDAMRRVGASAGRSTYRRALEAERLVFEARLALCRLFNIADPTRLVFTANATEALNLALKGFLRPGDEVVTSSVEHNAVWRPLKVLERTRGIVVTAVPCQKDGTLPLEALEKALGPRTRLVVLTHASNVVGTLLPVAEAGRLTRPRGIVFLVDAAQTAGVYPIDVEAMNIDLLAFTGHKGLLGPMGTGGLYVREGVELVPLKEGGTGGQSLLEEQPSTLPERYEAGTMNVPGLAGLKAGVETLVAEGVDRVRKREKELTAYALQELASIPGLVLYGPGEAERQVGIVSFNLEGLEADRVALLLDRVYDIQVRAGLHCAPQAHRTIGTLEQGTVRVGLGYFNREGDVKALVRALRALRAAN